MQYYASVLFHFFLVQICLHFSRVHSWFWQILHITREQKFWNMPVVVVTTCHYNHHVYTQKRGWQILLLNVLNEMVNCTTMKLLGLTICLWEILYPQEGRSFHKSLELGFTGEITISSFTGLMGLSTSTCLSQYLCLLCINVIYAQLASSMLHRRSSIKTLTIWFQIVYIESMGLLYHSF